MNELLSDIAADYLGLTEEALSFESQEALSA